MAFTNLRWLCAPLLLVSSVALSQGAPDLPPVFTQYVVPYDDLISTPRGDGACVAGFVEAICSTGGSNVCLSYKENEDDAHYSMRVRSTGYYCGEWEESNDLLEFPPEAIGLTDDQLAEVDRLTERVNSHLDDARSWRNTAFHADFNSPAYKQAVSNVSVYLHNAILNLRLLSELTTSSISGLRDYTDRIDSHYESIEASNKAVIEANLKISSLESEIAAFDSFTQRIEADVSNLESILSTFAPDGEYDLSELPDKLAELEDGISGAVNLARFLFDDSYRLIQGLRRDYQSLDDYTLDLSDAIDSAFDYVDSEMMDVSDRIDSIESDAVNAARIYTDGEISSLSAAIDAGNADIASSIDGQTGEIVGAIDGQSSIISDGFSDLTDFFGDGEPSAGDLANQDSELSGLVSDYDYFVDYKIDIGEAVCPAPYQLDLYLTGKTVYVSFEPICEASLLVKPLLIAASSVAFALIVMGVRRA